MAAEQREGWSYWQEKGHMAGGGMELMVGTYGERRHGIINFTVTWTVCDNPWNGCAF